ncbi:MAG TPA: AAA family ATPase [Candidatus Acidoferrum sp.]|nr:AAA family ATPase [Candidatus Acidoferrum sp.]
MYKTYFGLKANPFNPNPDPRFLFLTGATREALAALAYGIRNRKGFLLLTGEVGTGKTTLLNRLMEWLSEEKVATAFIFNSRLNEGDFFDFVLNDFGIACESRDKSQRLIRLNQWLIDRYRERRAAVLIVDEAQNLSNDVLEEIRLLTNMETTQEKLLQIVLSGQPELEEKLRDPALRQLRQRITIRCSTAPLSREEMQSYVAERLRVAGANGVPIFSVEAIDAVYKHSQGIPRIANLLCEHSLINAFVDQMRPIPARIVDEVSREFEFQKVSLMAHQLGENGATQEQIVEAVVRKLQELVERIDANKSSTAAAGGNPGPTRNPSTPGFKIPS